MKKHIADLIRTLLTAKWKSRFHVHWRRIPRYAEIQAQKKGENKKD